MKSSKQFTIHEETYNIFLFFCFQSFSFITKCGICAWEGRTNFDAMNVTEKCVNDTQLCVYSIYIYIYILGSWYRCLWWSAQTETNEPTVHKLNLLFIQHMYIQFHSIIKPYMRNKIIDRFFILFILLFYFLSLVHICVVFYFIFYFSVAPLLPFEQSLVTFQMFNTSSILIQCICV